MGKYEYKAYRVDKKKNLNTRYLILALVVIIVVTVVLIKTRGDGTSVSGLSNNSGNEANPADSGNTSQGSVTDSPRSADPVGGAFVPPANVERVEIDPATGALALAGCPERRPEFFLEGTLPKQTCPAGKVAGAREDESPAIRRRFFEWLRRQIARS